MTESEIVEVVVGSLSDSEGDPFDVTFKGIDGFEFLQPSFDSTSGDVILAVDVSDWHDKSQIYMNYTITIVVTEDNG